MKKLIANLSYSFAANLVTMLVSVLTVLLLPGFLGEVPYGYYQLYLFYISYVGFFHLGWVDGIYLRIGGKEYAGLDRKLYGTQFYLLTAFAAAAALVILVISAIWIPEGDRQFVMRMFCLCIVIYLPVTYLNYLFQATGRIKEYAKILLSEKTVFVVCMLVMLLTGTRSFRGLVLADLAGKALSLGLAVFYGRDLLFSGLCRLKTAFGEMLRNISVGCKLMIANVAGMLIIGIVRYAIQAKWGVAVFGKVSLSLSVSNLFINFMTAVSVVAFPALRQADSRRRSEIYEQILYLLMPALLFLFIFYSPAEAFLEWLLPAWKESLRYLVMIMPVCVFECKMSLLVNTYLKVLRKEKQILYVNLAVMAFSLLLTLAAVYLFHSLNGAVFVVALVTGTRVYFAELLLGRMISVSVGREILMEILACAAFILGNWFLGGWRGTLIYAAAWLLYFLQVKGKFFESLSAVSGRKGHV